MALRGAINYGRKRGHKLWPQEGPLIMATRGAIIYGPKRGNLLCP